MALSIIDVSYQVFKGVKAQLSINLKFIGSNDVTRKIPLVVTSMVKCKI